MGQEILVRSTVRSIIASGRIVVHKYSSSDGRSTGRWISRGPHYLVPASEDTDEEASCTFGLYTLLMRWAKVVCVICRPSSIVGNYFPLSTVDDVQCTFGGCRMRSPCWGGAHVSCQQIMFEG